ncbi:CGNR zinc finger domain-containing protein [Actinacidiphila glaucinigra]|uniref:CGNR zinc finger domain-containing protein n=1 Tax=Actinacidiphila glaucinigra TaxID=235986 RepID=UPI00367213CC
MTASPKEQPEVLPAPGAEQYPALDLVNSVVTLPGGQSLDLLDTPSETERWLTAHGLAPKSAELQESDVERLRALRAHIRSVIVSKVHGRPASEADLEAVNEALIRTPAAPLLRWDPVLGLHRTAVRPDTEFLDQALARLAADAADLLTGPDAERLTACGSTPCSRYLLRHGRRHWCSTRCGDRARAARAYARRTRSVTVQ